MTKHILTAAHSRTVKTFGEYGHIAFFGQVFIDHGISFYGAAALLLAAFYAFSAYMNEVEG